MIIKMNAVSGKALYDLCLPTFEALFMDIGDIMEEFGISIDRFNQYFRGERDIPYEHLFQIARVCSFNLEALIDYLEIKYSRGI